MQTTTLRWYGPFDAQRLQYNDVMYGKGIYAVYQVFRNQERLLYIGKTTRDFLMRLNEHFYWLNTIQGQVKIRVGIIELEKGQRFSRKMLADVESLLITWHTPIENTVNANITMGEKS